MDIFGRGSIQILKHWRRLLICGIIIVVVPILLLPLFINVHANSSGTWQQYTYDGSAGSLVYFVYTPANYQVGTAAAMVVMLHGCAQTPADFAAGTQMDQLADQKQFIVVYPQETTTNNQEGCWKWFDPADQARGSGEPAIITGIVQTVEHKSSQWTLDLHRVYVTGLSAALRQGGPDPMQQGQVAYNAMGSAARVVPTISFHGTSDYLVYPLNGEQVVRQWMQTNHLASHNTYNASFQRPTSTTNGQVAGGHSYTRYTWNDTKGNEVQEYWVVNGMGHAWSGGSSSGSFTDSQGPSATEAMYTFFMSHPS
jgi:poly(3-hydroxybutyrate) depolymerase